MGESDKVLLKCKNKQKFLALKCEKIQEMRKKQELQYFKVFSLIMRIKSSGS